MLWTTLLFIVTIGVLITIHEFGHYWVARRCGVKIERFSIGLGPKLFSFRTAEDTEFVIAAIPLGGYVKMLDGRTCTLTKQNEMFAFDKQSIGKRAAIISAGPIANLMLAFVIYWIIFQLGVVSYPVRLLQTTPDSAASSLNISPNAELKVIDDIKIEDWQDVRLALLNSLGKQNVRITYLPSEQTKAITRIADIHHWKIDIEKEDPIRAFGFVPKKPNIIPVLIDILPHSPAEQAGLLVGDHIIRFNGQPLDDWSVFTNYIKQGERLNLEIERHGQRRLITLTPKMQENAGKQKTGFAGIVPTTDISVKRYNAFFALNKSLKQMGLIIKVTVRSFYQLITGSLSLENLSGPVTIAKSASQSASYGIVAYLYFLAFISISLGVVNLIPLPILDGGHLLFLLIEKIKGSPLSENKLTWIYKMSFLLLIMIMGIALFNDFSRLSF